MTNVSELKRFFQNQMAETNSNSSGRQAARDNIKPIAVGHLTKTQASIDDAHEPGVRLMNFNYLTGHVTHRLNSHDSNVDNSDDTGGGGRFYMNESLENLIDDDQMVNHSYTESSQTTSKHQDHSERYHSSDNLISSDNKRKKFFLYSFIKRRNKTKKADSMPETTDESKMNLDKNQVQSFDHEIDTRLISDEKLKHSTARKHNEGDKPKKQAPQPMPRKSLAVTRAQQVDHPSGCTSTRLDDHNNEEELIKPRKLNQAKQNDPRLVAQKMIVSEFKMLTKRRSLIEMATISRSQQQPSKQCDSITLEQLHALTDHASSSSSRSASPNYVNLVTDYDDDDDNDTVDQSFGNLSLTNLNINDESIYESLHFDRPPDEHDYDSEIYDLPDDNSIVLSDHNDHLIYTDPSYPAEECLPLDIPAVELPHNGSPPRSECQTSNNNNEDDNIINDHVYQSKANMKNLFRMFKKKELAAMKYAMKAAKKFSLTGFEVPLCTGTVKDDNTPSSRDKDDLSVKRDDIVLILRIHHNPPGKYLAKSEQGRIGYIDLSNITVDAESVKTIIKVFGPKRCNDIDFPISEL